MCNKQRKRAVRHRSRHRAHVTVPHASRTAPKLLVLRSNHHRRYCVFHFTSIPTRWVNLNVILSCLLWPTQSVKPRLIDGAVQERLTFDARLRESASAFGRPCAHRRPEYQLSADGWICRYINARTPLCLLSLSRTRTTTIPRCLSQRVAPAQSLGTSLSLSSTCTTIPHQCQHSLFPGSSASLHGK